MPFNTDVGVSLLAMAPLLLLTVLITVVIALDIVWPESRRREIGIVAAVGLFGIALVALIFGPPAQAAQQLVLGGMYRFDTLTQIFGVTTLVGAGIASLISLESHGIGNRGDYYTVLLTATLGALVICGASDIIFLFLGLETLSISLYCLAGFQRNNERSSEAGLKYFLFGAFTSTIMLYGISLLYGFTGHTNLYMIGAALKALFTTTPPLETLVPVLVAMLLILVGFGFKVSMVPFHFWTPDVYEGAPTPVTAYISVASKAASFAVFARFMLIVFQGAAVQDIWIQLLAIIALVTMTVGNLLALPQKNIKRLLAYSSIAQAGYTLVGLAAVLSQQGTEGSGIAALSFYMVLYVFTNLAGFGAIILFANATGSEEIKDFAGLSRRNLPLALILTIALLSLAGIPPAAGFVGKFFLFRAAVDANLTWLAIAGVLNSIVALYYYLIVIKVMFVDHGADEDKAISMSNPYVVALGLATIGVLLLGIIPGPVYDWALRAAQQLFS